MFKKINLLAAMLFCVVLFVGCGDFEYSKTEDGSGVEITKYTGTKTDVVIPEKLGGKPVKVIWPGAFAVKDDKGYDMDYAKNFETRKNIKSVTFPNSGVRICDHAFRGCEKLESVKLPENDELVMGHGVFMETGLKEVTFYGNVKAYSTGDCILAGCYELERVVFESGVKEINLEKGYLCDYTNRELKEIVFKSPDTVVQSANGHGNENERDNCLYDAAENFDGSYEEIDEQLKASLKEAFKRIILGKK